MSDTAEAMQSLGTKAIRAQHGLPHDLRVAKIGPGEHRVTQDSSELIVTVLGSCVAACMRDPVAQVGGMNHFMLPESETGNWSGATASLRYGNFAMEELINDILKRGGRRERIEVKLMGGGKVLDNCIDIGARNAEFAVGYVRDEGLRLLASDLKGDIARRVHFLPVAGRLWLKRIPRSADLAASETQARGRALTRANDDGGVELFT